jgi:MFS family permease
VALAIPVAVLAVPLGRLVDRSRRMTLMVLMSAIWSGGTIWTAFAQDLATLFLARMLAGLGAMCSVVVVISLIADMTSRRTRGRAMMLPSIGIQVGGALAFALGGPAAGALASPGAVHILGLAPWRETHLVFGIASALLTLPLLFLREPERHEIVGDVALGPALRTLWERRGFLFPLFIGQVGVVMADVAAGIWAAPVLVRSYRQTPAEFGPWVGGVLVLAGIAGAALGGLAADVGQKVRYRGGLLLGAVIPALIAVPAAAFPVMPDVQGFAWMFGTLIFCGAAAGLITATAIAVEVPNEARGVCLGAFVVVAAVIGFGVAPTLVSVGSNLLGGEAHLSQSLAVTGVAIDAFSAMGFVLAMLHLGRRPAQPNG